MPKKHSENDYWEVSGTFTRDAMERDLKKLNIFVTWVLALPFVLFVGCAKSPKGQVEELVKTRPITFGGVTSKNFTTPSTPFTLSGECDPISYDIEYSYNSSTWVVLPGKCPSGTFSFNVNIPGGTRKVYMRAKTKTTYTPTSLAQIRLLLPPTSPYFAFVSSGHAGDEVDVPPATQNAIEHNFTSSTLTNGAAILKQSLVDVIYE